MQSLWFIVVLCAVALGVIAAVGTSVIGIVWTYAQRRREKQVGFEVKFNAGRVPVTEEKDETTHG